MVMPEICLRSGKAQGLINVFPFHERFRNRYVELHVNDICAHMLLCSSSVFYLLNLLCASYNQNGSMSTRTSPSCVNQHGSAGTVLPRRNRFEFLLIICILILDTDPADLHNETQMDVPHGCIFYNESHVLH